MLSLFQLIRERCLNLAQRSFSAMSNGEQKIHDVLKVSFPKAQTISVQDISGIWVYLGSDVSSVVKYHHPLSHWDIQFCFLV